MLNSLMQKINNFIEKLKGDSKKSLVKKLIGSAVVFLMAVAVSVLLSLNHITVNDGNTTQRFYSLKSAASKILCSAKLESENYKVISMTSDKRKIEINIRYTFPVYVTVGDTTHTVDLISGKTVAEAISLAGIELDEHDSVNLPLTDSLSETTYIDVTDVSYVTESYTEKIPYAQKTVYSYSTSSNSITTKGEDGEMNVTKVTKLVNGVAQSSEIVEQTVIKEAVDQVITVGTRPANTISELSGNVQLDSNGNPINYKKHITVQATAYTGGGRPASGMEAKPGCVAVNTSIFPYGTKFYIKSSDGQYIYGYAVAGDTGGFVSTRPTNFDLYFNTESECIAFGRRNIEVWVLE